jgi:hypothetical protein
MPNHKERALEDMVKALRDIKGQEKRATLLIGAGCSLSGDIPLAGTIVEDHKDRFSAAFKRAEDTLARDTHAGKPNLSLYPYFMAELTPAERDEIINGYLEKEQINWAHIAIAQLLKNGYIGRILTVNFDRLIVRACGMLNHFPAIYDFSSLSTAFDADTIPEGAVFYLHGQGLAQPLIHRLEESANVIQGLEPLLEETFRSRPVIVAGYSGLSDPIFNLIVKRKSFRKGLFWTNYQDKDPAEHLCPLLDVADGAYYVRNQDADDLFVRLCQKLECFPPTLISDPFEHMIEVLKPVKPYRYLEANNDSKRDVLETTRKKLQDAKNLLGENEEKSTGNDSDLVNNLRDKIFAGEYQEAIDIANMLKNPNANEVRNELRWAYINLGAMATSQAKHKSGQESDDLFKVAYENFAHAVRVKSDEFEAYNGWASSILHHAKLKTGSEFGKLLDLAEEKALASSRFFPDSGSYNLACVYSLRNQEKECKQWLEKSHQAGRLPNCDHISKDADFDSMREKPWFKEFLVKVGCV